jgi:hypothetical protein
MSHVPEWNPIKEQVMENRITLGDDRPQGGSETPPTIGEVLAELLAQYQVRFPQVRITVVETPVAAV